MTDFLANGVDLSPARQAHRPLRSRPRQSRAGRPVHRRDAGADELAPQRGGEALIPAPGPAAPQPGSRPEIRRTREAIRVGLGDIRSRTASFHDCRAKYETCAALRWITRQDFPAADSLSAQWVSLASTASSARTDLRPTRTGRSRPGRKERLLATRRFSGLRLSESGRHPADRLL